MTHLLRNAIDHGLETPQQRIAAGKPEQGTILLRAFHESGNVIIEMIDDGAGIDCQRVLNHALERGLIRPSDAAGMTDRDIMQLLFLPGFSTASQVTNISGRGVGLDVVKSNVERVGGSIDLQSFPGRGTSFKLKIPLTLAIIPALITSCHNERFAIPQVNLLEIVRIDGDAADGRRIEYVHGHPVLRLRGRLLPLVSLGHLLGYEHGDLEDREVFILVLQADGQEYGLIIDMVHDTEEIVVKPLDRHLKGVAVFAGGTIMGDGHVALILDVRAVAQYAQVLSKKQKSSFVAGASADAELPTIDRRSLLLFSLDNGRSQGAISLSSIARLEKFSSETIERSNGTEVVQYRDRILPLVRLGQLLNLDTGDAEEGALQVIVHNSSRGDIGFIVGDIIDVIEDSVDELQRREDAPGLIGSAVVHGRVTDFIDIESLASMVSGKMHQSPQPYADRSH